MEPYGAWMPVGGYDVTSTGGGNPFPPPIDSGGGGMGNMNSLMAALQGVKAPAAPTAQTPHLIQAPAPRAPTPTRGDQFMQLVQLLGNGGLGAGPQTPSVQPRLSQALGYR